MSQAELFVRAQRIVDNERQDALKAAAEAYVALQGAKQAYEDAIMRAAAAGVSNSRLAREFGVSETSVRMYIKRRKDRTK